MSGVMIIHWKAFTVIAIHAGYGQRTADRTKTMPSDFNSPLDHYSSVTWPLHRWAEEIERERGRKCTEISGDLRCFEMAIVVTSKVLYEWVIYFSGTWHLVCVWLASCFGKVNPLTSGRSMLTWTTSKVRGLIPVSGQIRRFKGFVDSWERNSVEFTNVSAVYVQLQLLLTVNKLGKMQL